jgi:hypothetical protein
MAETTESEGGERGARHPHFYVRFPADILPMEEFGVDMERERETRKRNSRRPRSMGS